MVREIVRDTFFLGQKSADAQRSDLGIGQDLRDTLKANSKRCVGMAANMIGFRKRIIIVSMGAADVVMYNPLIISGSDEYEPFEGCLSLDGVRKARRFQTIELEYLDDGWKKHRQKFSGYIAQIIQHEIDHTNGIII